MQCINYTILLLVNMTNLVTIYNGLEGNHHPPKNYFITILQREIFLVATAAQEAHLSLCVFVCSSVRITVVFWQSLAKFGNC